MYLKCTNNISIKQILTVLVIVTRSPSVKWKYSRSRFDLNELTSSINFDFAKERRIWLNKKYLLRSSSVCVNRVLNINVHSRWMMAIRHPPIVAFLFWLWYVSTLDLWDRSKARLRNTFNQRGREGSQSWVGWRDRP